MFTPLNLVDQLWYILAIMAECPEQLPVKDLSGNIRHYMGRFVPILNTHHHWSLLQSKQIHSKMFLAEQSVAYPLSNVSSGSLIIFNPISTILSGVGIVKQGPKLTKM